MMIAAFAVKIMAGLVKLLFEGGYQGSYLDCKSCGKKAKFHRYSTRHILSCFGRLSFQRAYYYCRHCSCSTIPLDELLQLSHREFSPRLQRVIAFHSAHMSFEVVEKSIKESFDLSVTDEAIRQMSEELGQQAREWEEDQASSYQCKPLAQSTPQGPTKTWIIEIDGKRVGFQDGSWNEVKVGVIYELSDRIEPHTGRHELLKRELLARRCSWEEFVPQFWAAMHRAGIREADRVVAIADGAESIERIFDYVAAEATRIRDFYHVAERVYAIGELRFGAESKQAKQWIHLQIGKLKKSEVAAVVRSISHLKFEREEEEEKRRQVKGYLANHSYAMDYKKYKQEGLPLGSGAVEGGCRLIGYRTNGCGRRWGYEGCDEIVSLRVAVLNDRLDIIVPKPKVEKLAA